MPKVDIESGHVTGTFYIRHYDSCCSYAVNTGGPPSLSFALAISV
jgi:hypothetical protein